MKTKSSFCILLLILKPLFAFASACDVPKFDNFAPGSFRETRPDMTASELGMQPIANFRIPTGFLKWGTSPYGGVIFGEHAKGIKGGIMFETKESVSVHKKDVSPAEFILSIFKGLDEIGCKYLAGQKLEDQEYRLHALYPNGAELFAYGKLSEHHFYLIRRDKPEYVLHGLLKGINQSEFESILSTIQFQ